MTVLHGELEPRGLASVPRSASYVGRFGRLLRRLEPCPEYTVEQLQALAGPMQENVPTGWDPTAPVQDGDNDKVPAGYTYLGQFIDHDITFDPVSSLQRQNDPDALINFRTPRFDLDSVYGSGPRDEPFQYDLGSNPATMAIERNNAGEEDHPRSATGIALIGDPRNDENTIVSQLHLLFLQLHNRLLEQVKTDQPTLPASHQFEEAQRLVRWRYQWVIVEDFLRRLVDEKVFGHLWPQPQPGQNPNAVLPHYRARQNAYMPVEFSVAAFRFGHSMVRPSYDLNGVTRDIPIFVGGEPGPTDDLRGGKRLPDQWKVDWPLFFDMGQIAQPSRLINTKLSSALFTLPHSGGSLPLLNLLRGQALRLPSGQAVARHLGASAVYSGPDLGGVLDPTPLWFYLLKEAELEQKGQRLGFCGSMIVAETLLGLLEVDRQSFRHADPPWRPAAVESGATYTAADFIKEALGQ